MALKSPSSRRQNDLLISAINSNDLELLKKCVEQGADINATWPVGHHSIFTKAVENGNIDIVRFLIHKKARLKQTALYNTYTPLVVAIRSNLSLSLVKLLVDNAADVDERDISGRTPLNEAIALNKDSVVEYLLMHGADVNQADGSGRLPITLAVQNNRLEIVKLLTLRGADINRTDSRHDSALTLSQRLTDFSIFNYLETFAQRSLSSYSERAALRRREDQSKLVDKVKVVDGVVEKPEIVSFVMFPRSNPPSNTSAPQELLSSKQARSNSKYEHREEGSSLNNSSAPQRVLSSTQSSNNSKYDHREECSSSNNTSVPQEQSSKQTRNNSKYEEEEDSRNKNLLDLAILNDNLEEVERWLQGKNINKVDDDGFTPLAKAIRFGNIQMVEFFLSSKADTCKTVYGKTPLLLAVEGGNLEIIQLLLKHGAEHTIQTAFFEAINLGNLEIVKYFLQRGVEVNLIYKNGYTPLMRSLELGRFDVVKELVENGANVNMPDGSGRLPLMEVLESGDEDILSYFCDKGAALSTHDGCTILQKTVESGNLKIMKLLVEILKVDIDLIFGCGFSPLTKSTDLENLEMVKYLVTQNKDAVNKVDNNNKTPLAIAAKNQNLPIVKFLISSGAHTNEEVEEYANFCEDFALHLDITRGKYTKWK